jgi:hypothetical protein
MVDCLLIDESSENYYLHRSNRFILDEIIKRREIQ